MGRTAKISMAVVIVGAGAALAMLFPRGKPSETSPPSDRQAEASAGADQQQPAASKPTEPQQQKQPPQSGPRASLAVATSPGASAAGVSRKPPQLAPSYPANSVPRAATPSQSNLPPVANASPSEKVARRTEANPWPHGRTHRIADGDTLTSLAQRYLGDAQRWQEIQEANDGVLRDPDLLPIGVVLKIPPLERDAAKPEWKPPSSSPATSQTEAPLVPVPRGLLHGGK